MPSGTPTRVHVSHYWPALGGTNCGWFVAGECLSHMASGQRWQDWIGKAAACVREWPFGTIVTLPGGEQFNCQDRGGAIVTGPDGLPWIDLLVERAPVDYGAVVSVSVTYP
jgi:hypothetical protein